MSADRRLSLWATSDTRRHAKPIADDPPQTVVLKVRGPAPEVTGGTTKYVIDGVASGSLTPGEVTEVRLPVKDCESQCVWTLRGEGPPAGIPYPVYGAPGPLRRVELFVDGVSFE